MERMVNASLMWHLEKHKKISQQQYGFREKRSTIEPIAQLTTQVLNGFTNNQITIAISFDIEKAFDTIDQTTILNNLNKMGINGNMLSFVENYIRDRTITVKVGNKYSTPEK